jgi:hypothetical protein
MVKRRDSACGVGRMMADRRMRNPGAKIDTHAQTFSILDSSKTDGSFFEFYAYPY